jgi:hypothetical protein
MWILPSEFSKALEGLSRLGGGDGDGVPSWLEQTGSGAGAGAQIDTSGWFESHLPPAAEQPEASGIRASDLDPATLAAHAGLPDDGVTSGLPSGPGMGMPLDPTQWSAPTQQGNPPNPGDQNPV